MNSSETVGQRLRWAREQAGLSQGQVAKMLDYHRPTISQIEADQRKVRPDEIVGLANMYGVEEAWILKGDSAVEENENPRLALIARELRKLKNEDLEALLRVIRIMKTKGKE